MRDEQRHIPLIIRPDILPPLKRAKGGLATHANRVREAGRYGDDMLIHVNKDEFNQLRDAWGEPTINPQTGMPEYFLSGLRKWFSENPVASAVLPAAASVLFPGIGGAIGSTVNGALGGVLGSTASAALGNGLLGAGVGALTGGGKGALIGALGGAGGSLLQGALGGGGGLSSLFGGLGSGSSAAGSSGTSAIAQGDGGFHGANTSSAGVDAGTTGNTSAGGGLLGGLSLGNMDAKTAMQALGAIGTIASAFHKQKNDAVTQSQQNVAAANARFNQPLPQATFDRQRAQFQGDPRLYGQTGGQSFYTNNQLPALAAGGQPPVPHGPPSPPGPPGPPQAGPPQGALSTSANYVQGHGSGRADKIPSMLSDGEYVMDAETVGMLGDGSNKEGAKRLDQMRAAVRQHKGKALAKGKISPNAKPPAQYLPKGALAHVG